MADSPKASPTTGDLPNANCRWSGRRSSMPKRRPREDLRHADAGEASSSFADTAAHEEARQQLRARGDASLPRSRRFAMLAASIAAAAALGSFVGSFSAPSIAHSWSAGPAGATFGRDSAASRNKAELAELAALKTNLDGCRAQRQRPVRQACRAARSYRARADRAGSKLAPHRRRGRSAGEEKRSSRSPQVLRRRKQPARLHRQHRRPKRNYLTISCRTGSCRTCAAAVLWSRTAMAACSTSRPAVSFPVSAGSRRQAAGRPMGRRHRARRHHRSLKRDARANRHDRGRSRAAGLDPRRVCRFSDKIMRH